MSLANRQQVNNNFPLGPTQKPLTRNVHNKENVQNYANKENLSTNPNLINKENVLQSKAVTFTKPNVAPKPKPSGSAEISTQKQVGIRKQIDSHSSAIPRDEPPKHNGSSKKESKCGSGFGESYWFDNKENVCPNFFQNASPYVTKDNLASEPKKTPMQKTPNFFGTSSNKKQPSSAYKPQPSSAYKPHPTTTTFLPITPVQKTATSPKKEKAEKEMRKEELREIFDELFDSDNDIYEEDIELEVNPK
jgi:hypothetical protein